jgi:DNA repair photolyase
MRRFTGHTERWGEFVDVRQNIAEQLDNELHRIESKKSFWDKRERIWLSIVTDPYQPIEKKYRNTRKCLEVLVKYRFPFAVLTRSPLVLHDIDLFKQFEDCEIGLSITTDRDDVRKIFEPNSPSIQSRLTAMKRLHDAGVKTFAFIGPMLPMSPEKLGDQLAHIIDSAILDRMNYVNKTQGLYRQHKLEYALTESYFSQTSEVLENIFREHNVPVT